MKEIEVISRYGDIHKLVPYKDKSFIFKPADEYIRVGVDEFDDTEYEFVDPSGGPFISEGYKFDDNNVVKRIFRGDEGIVIEMK